MTTNDGGPAFPRQHTVADATDPCFKIGNEGMTLRDWFAGQALAGWMASFRADMSVKPIRCAEFAYELADAMLAARSA